ncbi:helix-turn-helix transcriptional regulator [Kaistia adipata]|uniref:helix-turn-helix transcriptional regulator n=1 Tax=Kaistia adipata TaxID=166954 RepID=UPI00055EFEEB|nr:hypothetical protein [Kaistia adipata]
MSTSRKSILAGLPVVLGLGETEAAAAIGVSATTFRALVQSRVMPQPRRIQSRFVYDIDELRAAFKSLPHKEEVEVDTWADIQ